jgi:hypothetical protein
MTRALASKFDTVQQSLSALENLVTKQYLLRENILTRWR